MYFLAAIAILQGILTLLDGMRAARHMRTFRPRRFSRERVAVFCPCKGADSEFVKNTLSELKGIPPGGSGASIKWTSPARTPVETEVLTALKAALHIN